MGEGRGRSAGAQGRGEAPGWSGALALNLEVPVLISHCCHRARCFRHFSCPPGWVGSGLCLQGPVRHRP